MQYLNLETRFLHAAEYIGADPRARGTWLSAMLWCAQQENSGRIAGAAAWGNRRFEQTFGATRREIDAAAPLLVWDGNDLVVWGYPQAQQEKYHAAAERARINGRAGGRPSGAESPASQEPRSEPKSVLTLEPKSQTVRKRKGTEDKETLGAGVLPFPGIDPRLEESGPPAAPSRPRDVLFDALARAEGSDPNQLTKAGARTIAVALADIRRASPDVTVPEINSRAAMYRRALPAGCTLTAAALAKHWARCSGQRVARVDAEPAKPEPAGWLQWLEANMPATDEDGPRSQLLAAKNCQTFAMMPGTWQGRCLAELENGSRHRSVLPA
jgi:hypothetical protein